jgi:hypothetical protein
MSNAPEVSEVPKAQGATAKALPASTAPSASPAHLPTGPQRSPVPSPRKRGQPLLGPSKLNTSVLHPQKIFDKKKRPDKRLAQLTQPLPIAPPLSQPIDYLSDKLKDVKMFFTNVPDNADFDWDSQACLKASFKPFADLGDLGVPVCLLQDAITVQDKLIVVNWWRWLTKDEQVKHLEQLRDVYATPKVSNRRLPADYWEKIARYNKSLQPKPPPTPAPAKRDFKCPGWTGNKYNEIFQRSFKAFAGNLTLEGGAKLIASVPVSSEVSQAKGAKDLEFRAEGDNYVLRSKQCNGRMEEKFTVGSRCIHCSEHRNALVGIVTRIGNWKSTEQLLQESREEMRKVKHDMRNLQRREARARERLDDAKLEHPELFAKPNKKRRVAAESLTEISNYTPASPTARQQHQLYEPSRHGEWYPTETTR